MCCIRLTNVKHCKNCFTRVRTTQAVVQAKQPIFHTIMRRTFTVLRGFYFSISELKKLRIFKLEQFFFSSDIEKLKTALRSLHRVTIWLLSLDYSSSVVLTRAKQLLHVMFYIRNF